MKISEYTEAQSILKKINEVEKKITDLYNSELKINAETESKEWTLYDVKVSKQQIKSIIKYNRELYNLEKKNWQNKFNNI